MLLISPSALATRAPKPSMVFYLFMIVVDDPGPSRWSLPRGDHYCPNYYQGLLGCHPGRTSNGFFAHGRYVKFCFGDKSVCFLRLLPTSLVSWRGFGALSGTTGLLGPLWWLLDRLLVVSMLEMAVFTVFPVLRVDLVEFCLGFMRLWNIFWGKGLLFSKIYNFCEKPSSARFFVPTELLGFARCLPYTEVVCSTKIPWFAASPRKRGFFSARGSAGLTVFAKNPPV